MAWYYRWYDLFDLVNEPLYLDAASLNNSMLNTWSITHPVLADVLNSINNLFWAILEKGLYVLYVIHSKCLLTEFNVCKQNCMSLIWPGHCVCVYRSGARRLTNVGVWSELDLGGGRLPGWWRTRDQEYIQSNVRRSHWNGNFISYSQTYSKYRHCKCWSLINRWIKLMTKILKMQKIWRTLVKNIQQHLPLFCDVFQ